MNDARPSQEPRLAVVHLGRNGGGPKFTFELARACVSNGADVLSVVAAGADNLSDFERTGRVLAFPTFSTSVGAVLRSPLSVINGLRFAAVLIRHNVDAVVIGMEQIWQLPLLVAARLLRRPVLLCVHDATMHPGDANVVERVLRASHRKLATGFITFSGYVADSLGESQRKPVFRSIHAVYGADRLSAPRRLPTDGRSPVVGFFGRLSLYKGLELGYRAIELLRASGHPVVFRVVGQGDASSVPEMHDEGDDVRQVWTADEGIPELLGGFDVLLLPYLEASQSGVLAYALSAALPSVVTPVGGLIEQAEETGAAVIADAVSAEAIAAAVARLLDNPPLYEAVSGRAASAATGSHSWSRVASDVFVALDVIGRRRMSTEMQVTVD